MLSPKCIIIQGGMYKMGKLDDFILGPQSDEMDCVYVDEQGRVLEHHYCPYVGVGVYCDNDCEHCDVPEEEESYE
jgi:hypothetical protein